jgi:hypothetical protein
MVCIRFRCIQRRSHPWQDGRLRRHHSPFVGWKSREVAIRGRKRSRLRRHHSPVVGWKEEGEAGCGGTTAHSWGGRLKGHPWRGHGPCVGWFPATPSVVCALKRNCFLKIVLGVTFNGHPTANKTPCGDCVFRLGLRI